MLLNVIPANCKVWTKQDTNGAAYRRYTITTNQNQKENLLQTPKTWGSS